MKQLAALSSVIVISLLALTCGGGPEEGSVAADLPSEPHPVVILAIDGLRADALGCYGGPAATPGFDALAASSARFEWAFAQAPDMVPSLGSLLSGLYPTTNGLRAPEDELQPEAVTLAEVLGAAGVPSAAFVEGLPGGADHGLAQGFDSYQVVQSPGVEGLAWMTDHADQDFVLLIAGWGSAAGEMAAAMLGNEDAVRAERVADVLASRDADVPLVFDDIEMARIRDWYATRIQLIDAFIGDFMNRFEALGLDRRATLVVTGTNGLALQEHGDLFGETVYAPVTRVPMMVRLPGGLRAGVYSRIVEVLDLMPTVVELSGAEPPAGVQGASLLPIIDGLSTPPYVAFGESPHGDGQRYVALAGYRAVVTGDDELVELFHTAVDPLELDDLAELEPDKLAKLLGDLGAWSRMVTATSLDPELRTEAELDDETLKQLKSLGYVQ